MYIIYYYFYVNYRKVKHFKSVQRFSKKIKRYLLFINFKQSAKIHISISALTELLQYFTWR